MQSVRELFWRGIFSLRGFFRVSTLLYPLNRRKSYYRIPIEDELSLSLWDKWRKYKQFPYKFVVHCCLVLVISIQCIMFASQRVPFLLATNGALEAAFQPQGEVSAESPYSSESSFITRNAVIDSIRDTVWKYYQFPNQSVDYFSHISNHNNNTSKQQQQNSVLLTIAKYRNMNLSSIASHDIVDRSKDIEQHHLHKYDPLGPFASQRESDAIFDALAWFTLDFRLRTINIEEYVAECVVWHLTNRYEFTHRGGQIPVRLELSSEDCHDFPKISNFNSLIRAPIFWTNTIIAVLSIISFILTFFAIFRAFRLYKMSQREGLNYSIVRSFYNVGIFRDEGDLSSRDNILGSGSGSGYGVGVGEGMSDLDVDQNQSEQNHHRSFDFSSVKERIKLLLMFLRMWLIITLVGDILNIAASVMIYLSLIQRNLENVTLTATVLGLSAMFVWINIVKYLEHAPKFYLLINALRKGMPNVVRFLIGALPVFVGYALCGTMLFGTYAAYFSSLDRSAVTLFAVLNGDVIHDVFDMIYGQNKVVAIFSRIYLYSFICLFIYAVLNIFILIMEDAFFSLKGSAIHPAYPPPRIPSDPMYAADQQNQQTHPYQYQYQAQQPQQYGHPLHQQYDNEYAYGTFVPDINGDGEDNDNDNDDDDFHTLWSNLRVQLEEMHDADNLTFAQRQALEKTLFTIQKLKEKH